MAEDDIVIKHIPGIKHKSELYHDGWISFMLCGKSGCGKTSLMAQLIPGISDKIKFICIATQVYRNPFHLAIKDWAEKHHIICVINSDPEAIRNFVTQLHAQGMLVPGEQEMLLIFDDFSIHNRSGSKQQNLVIEAFTRWRNLGVNLVVVCQDATMVAPNCRNCVNMSVLFSSNAGARYNFNKAFIDMVPDRAAYDNLMKYITSVPYSYVLIRYGPFEVSVGKGTNIKKVMDEHSVIVPTYRELMAEIGADSPEKLNEMTMSMQKKIGNTAHQLDGKGLDDSDSSDDEY
jgi:hypothetical protein